VDKKEHHFDPISVIFGVIQTALYIDFAWVYWTRQRVKLRGGGIVDSEDLRRGWLVGRLVGKHSDLDDDDEEAAAATDGSAGAAGSGGTAAAASKTKKPRWGKRGISVSADDAVHGEDSQPLTNPDAFEDLDDDEDDALPGPATQREDHETVGDGSEWVDDEDHK